MLQQISKLHKEIINKLLTYSFGSYNTNGKISNKNSFVSYYYENVSILLSNTLAIYTGLH